MDIGPVTGRGSVNREGRSIQQTLYLRLGSSPGKQIGEFAFLGHFGPFLGFLLDGSG
jgi:hypothetical protein